MDARTKGPSCWTIDEFWQSKSPCKHLVCLWSPSHLTDSILHPHVQRRSDRYGTVLFPTELVSRNSQLQQKLLRSKLNRHTQMLLDTDFLVQSCWCFEKEVKVMIRLNPPQLFSLIGYVETDTPHEIQTILWVVSMRVCLQMCHRLLILPLALRLKLCSLWCSSSPRGVPASLIRANLSPTPVHL